MWMAVATTFLAGIIYFLTVQPTLSFWDCGEFIACASILGVPHPPGTPLFVLIGRIFSILPIGDDVSYRVNLLSVASGAVAVGVAYMVASTFLRRWILRDAQFWGREFVIITGSFCSAMLLGFSATVWNNAVEAEVYGITLAIFMIIMYSSLIWIEVRYTPLGPRLLIFATYMAVFGLGVHMMVYLAIPGMWLMVFMLHEGYRKDWRVWAGALATLLVVGTGTEAFLWNLIFVTGIAVFWRLAPFDQKRKMRAWIVPLWAVSLYLLFSLTFPIAMFEQYGWSPVEWLVSLLIFGACLVGSFVAINEDTARSKIRWGFLTGIGGAALMAFTLQLYIPIRSLHDPKIDENNPETWTSFKSFLERKQYGQQSMVSRMFKRRGLWQNQLGRHPRMGFWGFFQEQYLVTGQPFYFLFLLGMLPFVVPFIRSGAAAKESIPDRFAVYIFLSLTLMATTVGLVVYMNFADGVFYNALATDQAYLEVRDRDYFFTTGFGLFGLCIGLGAAWLTAFVAQRFKSLAKPVVAVMGLVTAIWLPLGTVSANWFKCDRSQNYIPYDYAYNILNGCPPNSILFTNGDNDTFPVWCLQEAYGIRTDVKVVNLSLVNTDWYILQMKHQYDVPMNLTDDQIKTVPERLPDGRLYGRPKEQYYDQFRGYKHDLVPYMSPPPESKLIRVQDQMMEQIILANNWAAPVYFSGNYSGETELQLSEHIEMQGQGYRFVRKQGRNMHDTEESYRLYDSTYRYRSFGDLDSYQDESTASLLLAYPEKMIQLSTRLFSNGDTVRALQMAEKAREVVPAYWRTYGILAGMYSQMGSPDDSARVIEEGLRAISYLREVNPGNVLYIQAHALVLDGAGRTGEALTLLSDAFDKQPKEELIFITLAQLGMRAGDQVRLQQAARLWLGGHPNDSRARSLLSFSPPPATAPPPTPVVIPGGN